MVRVQTNRSDGKTKQRPHLCGLYLNKALCFCGARLNKLGMECARGRAPPIEPPPDCSGHPEAGRSFVFLASVYTRLGEPEILRAIASAL